MAPVVVEVEVEVESSGPVVEVDVVVPAGPLSPALLSADPDSAWLLAPLVVPAPVLSLAAAPAVARINPGFSRLQPKPTTSVNHTKPCPTQRTAPA